MVHLLFEKISNTFQLTPLIKQLREENGLSQSCSTRFEHTRTGLLRLSGGRLVLDLSDYSCRVACCRNESSARSGRLHLGLARKKFSARTCDRSKKPKSDLTEQPFPEFLSHDKIPQELKCLFLSALSETLLFNQTPGQQTLTISAITGCDMATIACYLLPLRFCLFFFFPQPLR